jgi:hypothetical protein
MLAQSISPALGRLSARQRRVQCCARRLCFKDAVRLTADAFFRFTHRAIHENALWSETVCVWLGSATFIQWAMGEVHVDIPRIVAGADGAPDKTDALRDAVHEELRDYWEDCLASLPPKDIAGWRPLP